MRLEQIRGSLPPEADRQARDLAALAGELDSVREEDIRGISHRLHPAIVRVGAAAGLRSLRNFYTSLVPVEVTVTETAERLEPPGQSVIPESIRLGVYRIAELALGNVARHARASVCRVLWDHDPDAGELRLTVEDDGIGFEPDSAGGDGIGILTINDYTDAMEGAVAVESAPGRGARISVTVPFAPPVTSAPAASSGATETGFAAAGPGRLADNAHGL
jgi:signal transduction histidine kinase